MSGRGPIPAASVALALVCLALVLVSGVIDLPRAADGEFWGDGATYSAMASSLARDLDVRYERVDLERVLAEHPNGPSGLFLKRTSGAWTLDRTAGFPWLRRVRADEGRLYYAKALAYPMLAAPFVRLLGTRGLTLVNGLLLSLALVLAAATLRRRGLSPWPALGVASALLLLTVTPLYLFWPTPEILGLALVMAGLWAWAAGRPLLSAVLFGIAGYLKPPNLLMAAPLGFEPLLPRSGERRAATLRRGLGEALRRGVFMLAATLACYGVNTALTGEWNYQGGERKTFYARYPFDRAGTSFDNAGFWMTTNQFGPLVAGADDGLVSERSGPARKRAELVETLAWNVLYFWVGRFGGALAYFFPALLAALLFLLRGPRDRAGWLALVAIVLSWAVYLWQIPDNWYGGGGTVGNRYFLNVLPAFLFLVPAARAGLTLLGGLLGFLVFLAPTLAQPVHHSLHPGEHATRGAFRLLPAELTMLNDLSVFTETWRKKRPYGFVGNRERHADADAFSLYFTDDGTFGKEQWSGRDGFWLRAGRPAEVVLRAFDIAPVERIVLELQGGPLGDSVDVRLGWQRARLRISPGERRTVELAAPHGVPYYDTYLYVLHLRSRRGARLADGREVGAFVAPRLVTGQATTAR